MSLEIGLFVRFILRLDMLIINPGSENKGGTLEQAKLNAAKWLKSIHAEGFKEVEMKFIEQYPDGGNFRFDFVHKVTKKVAILEIHGFDKKQCEKFTFHPRVYWQGSSTADPKIEDWLGDGFTFRVVYEKKRKK
jgi:hypothetical protein